ncbi:hypothetical protein MTO96_037265 [Rhipicephalus appendiculatus]
MLWLLLIFAGNPDTIQARVQREIDEVIEQDRHPTWENRKLLPYTMACIWEVERWRTTAPLGVAKDELWPQGEGVLHILRETSLLKEVDFSSWHSWLVRTVLSKFLELELPKRFSRAVNQP